MNYFVTGLPRSRTAWLSIFLSRGQFCFHEGFDGCHSIEAYKQKLGPDNGDCNTGLMLMDVEKEFPDAPIVIIHRDPAHSIEYMYKTFGIYNKGYVDYLCERLQELKGLHIEFDEIDDRLEDIWNYVLDVPFDHEWANNMKKMDIQLKDPFGFDQDALAQLWECLKPMGDKLCL